MKTTKRQLRRIIKEEIENTMGNQDPNIQKIEDIVYSLPNVTRENFILDIVPPDEMGAPGEYEVFHSGYAMDKLASIAGLRSGYEIAMMFRDAGLVDGETWTLNEPIVLIDPKMQREK